MSGRCGKRRILGHQRQEHEALYQLAHDLARATDVRTIADHLFAHTQHLLGANYGFVMLAEEGGGALRGTAVYGMESATFQQERLVMGRDRAPALVAFEQQQPVVVADVAHSPLVSEQVRQRYGVVQSFWVVPLVSGEQALGVFGVGYAARREATVDELRVLQLLGNEAALALERARTIEALRQSEARFQRLAANFPGGMIFQFLLRPDGSVAFPYISPSCRELWEIEPDAIQRHAALVMDMIHPDDRTMLDESIMLSARTLSPWHLEFRVVTPSGTLKWFQGASRPEPQPNGDILWDGLLMDITARKQAEEALRGSEERYRTLFESAHDAIVGLTLDGVITTVNGGYERMTGRSRAEVIGHHHSQFVTPASAAIVEERVRRLQAKEKISPTYEQELLHANGNIVVVEVATRLLRDTEGRASGILAICRDITVRKQMEVELQRAKEAAEAANRAKSEFLANMSHEIRTPMNGILGMLGLLRDTPLLPEQHEYAQTAYSSAETLLGILNDILDFSKIEAGRLELETVAFELRDNVGDALKPLALRAQEKGVELLYDVRPEVPEVVVGDPMRLRQIIVNLVGNAIKFTERGEVLVEVAQAAEGGTEGVLLHVRVADTGIGIAADKRQQIFAAFAQADSSTTRRYGGTGLGLTISRQLVEMMGGRLWVESEVGVGSTFHFTVRLGRGQACPAVGDFSHLHGVRVLAVDDNATNRRILQDQLRAWGLEPTLAASAPEALALLVEAKTQGRPFPLMLTDVHMPEMDGFMLVERLKQDPALHNTIVLVLTSAEQRADITRCRELGIAVHLIKPVKPTELRQALVRALGRGSPSYEMPSPPVPTVLPHRPLQILVAEDNTVNQKLAVRLLQKWGHEVQIASTGKKAVEWTARERFDVVFMDVQMPEMDGFAATAAIRAREHGTQTHLPIIAMTAYAMKGDRERCLAAGMDGYISKPLKSEELLATLTQVSAFAPPLAGTAAQPAMVDEAMRI